MLNYNDMEKLSKQTALEFQSLIELIDTVMEELKNKDYKISISRKSHEYGFYLFSSDKKFSLFLGLWIDFWVDKGQPLVLVFDGDEKSYTEKLKILTTYSIDNSSIFKNKIIYEAYQTFVLDKNSIGKDADTKKYVTCISQITKLLSFNLNTINH
jgi:hypothetical protein